jgi:hypothetical protein
MSDTTAWDEYCEASLDLSNQDEVGEAGAIAALDDLYANNDEGMKRLAEQLVGFDPTKPGRSESRGIECWRRYWNKR